MTSSSPRARHSSTSRSCTSDLTATWFLAIAAYNYGSGNIQRAINRNVALHRSTDFFSLSLPAETRAYVPKLIALAKMIRSPEAYGFYLPPIPDTPYFPHRADRGTGGPSPDGRARRCRS